MTADELHRRVERVAPGVAELLNKMRDDGVADPVAVFRLAVVLVAAIATPMDSAGLRAPQGRPDGLGRRAPRAASRGDGLGADG